MAAGRKFMKKLLPKDAPRVKKVTELRSVVEDAVSRVMVGSFRQQIQEFSNNLSLDLENNAAMYVHGGAALNSFVEHHDLASQLQPFPPEIVNPIIQPPKDVDFSVIPFKPFHCDSMASCVHNPIIIEVTRHLRLLRHEIHNLLVSNRNAFEQILREIINDVQSEIPDVEDIELIDSSHMHIQPNKNKKKGGAMIVYRDVGKHNNMPCNADNMVGIKPNARTSNRVNKCFPLRDSINMSITFDDQMTFDGASANITNDFILCRLALVVRVKRKGVAKHTNISVNFVDVSVYRKGDQIYSKGSPKSVLKKVTSSSNTFPFPNLGLIAENTVRQLVFHEREKDTMIKGSLDYKNEEITILKLIRRLRAINILSYLVHDTNKKSSSRNRMDNVPPWIQEMVKDIPWLAADSVPFYNKYIGKFSEDVANFIQNRQYGDNAMTWRQQANPLQMIAAQAGGGCGCSKKR